MLPPQNIAFPLPIEHELFSQHANSILSSCSSFDWESLRRAGILPESCTSILINIHWHKSTFIHKNAKACAQALTNALSNVNSNSIIHLLFVYLEWFFLESAPQAEKTDLVKELVICGIPREIARFLWKNDLFLSLKCVAFLASIAAFHQLPEDVSQELFRWCIEKLTIKNEKEEAMEEENYLEILFSSLALAIEKQPISLGIAEQLTLVIEGRLTLEKPSFNSQIAYLCIFCLWILAIKEKECTEVKEILPQKESTSRLTEEQKEIPQFPLSTTTFPPFIIINLSLLIQILCGTSKEKIARIALYLLNSLLPHVEPDWNQRFQLLEALDSLSNHRFFDCELLKLLESSREILQKPLEDPQALWKAYYEELSSPGTISSSGPSSCTSNGNSTLLRNKNFWHKCSHMLNQDGCLGLKMLLKKLFSAPDRSSLSGALGDLACYFEEASPDVALQGRSVICEGEAGWKEKIVNFMAYPDAEIQWKALLVVQKLILPGMGRQVVVDEFGGEERKV